MRSRHTLKRATQIALLVWVPACNATPAQEAGLRVLRVEELVEGVIEDNDPVVHTETLDANYTQAPTVGKTFLIKVDRSGPYHVELRSWVFDSYLVLRDAQGNLLAEDDDGLVSTHSLLVVEKLDSGSEVTLKVCALHGARGPFELILLQGSPRSLSPQEQAAAELADLDRSVEVVEEIEGPESEGLARALNALGMAHYRQRRYAEAQDPWERALAINEKVHGPEHPSTARNLNNLARLLQDMGKLAAARSLYERALAIREKVLGPEHPDTVKSMHKLARLLLETGEFAAARPLGERALAIREKVLGPEHPDTVKSLNDLATLLQDTGELAAARPLYERALAINERVLGLEHPDTATSMNNLAGLLKEMGELDEAQPYFERALAIRAKVLGPEHPDTATSLNNLAALLLETGELDAARLYFERALAITGKVLGPEHPSTAASLYNLAILFWDTGEPERARDLLSRSAPGRRAHLQRMLRGLTEAESFQYIAKLRWHLELQLSLGVSESPEVLAEAYASLLAWKGQITRTLLASRGQIARGLNDEQRDLIRRLRVQQTQLSRLLSDEASPEQGEHLAALRKRNALELELGRTLEEARADRDVSLADVRAALPPRSAVLDLFVHQLYRPATWEDEELVRRGSWSEKHVIAWIVRPEGEAAALVRVDLGPAAALESASRAFLDHLVARRGEAVSEREGPAPVDNLRRILWDPVAGHLEGVDTLFVSPDSFLGTLPIETLSLEDGSLLIEHFGFVYLQDVASFAQSGAKPSPEYGSLLSMGAVEDESEVVSDMHGDAVGDEAERLLLRGAEATEERLKHELRRYSVLHLATHSFFRREAPMSGGEAAFLVALYPGLLSGLLCAEAYRPPEEGRDDGYLTAEEVGWLDLTNVELVVMSGCRTGLDRPKSGEGMIGLRRAFRTAGAKTVISSLWSVNDESTADLMRDFYKNLWLKGMGRLEALRSAQLAMLNKNRMEHGDPLPSTWGAFVLSGEWR